MTGEDVARIAAGLTKAQSLALTSDWDAFCDRDYGDMSCAYEGFTERLEESGFAFLDDVDDDDLEDAFAYERGIEAGRMIYRLTELGLAVRAHLQQVNP